MTVSEYEKYLLKRPATPMEASIFSAAKLVDLKRLFNRDPTRREIIEWI
jgi:hypothetical protein